MQNIQQDTAVIHYRAEGGLRVIDISAESVSELFSGLDPSPFGQKDLDSDVHSFILSAVEEIGGPSKVKIVIQLPQSELASASGLPTAFQNFFAYRAWANKRDLNRLLKTGYVSLLIGIVFLVSCLIVRHTIPDNSASTVNSVLSEGLIIVGWVALWRPLEIFLYDWWPVWRRKHLHL